MASMCRRLTVAATAISCAYHVLDLRFNPFEGVSRVITAQRPVPDQGNLFALADETPRCTRLGKWVNSIAVYERSAYEIEDIYVSKRRCGELISRG